MIRKLLCKCHRKDAKHKVKRFQGREALQLGPGLRSQALGSQKYLSFPSDALWRGFWACAPPKDGHSSISLYRETELPNIS